MTPDLVDLARRAVACTGWRWLPGMLGWRTTHDGRQVRVRFVESVEDQELVDPRIHERKPSMTPIVASGHAVVDGWVEVSTILPDLADPATLGCLLALVRHARGESTGFLTPAKGGGWTYWTQLYQADYFLGDTEAEALVAALEAAHVPRP